MTNTFNYRFDELPLAIVNGIEAAYVSGQAEIEYAAGGYWQINSVDLEGFGERINGVRQWPMVPAPAPISEIIQWRLKHQWAGRVLSAINEDVERDIEERAA